MPETAAAAPPPLVTFIHRTFAGRSRKFVLRIGEAEELETLCRVTVGEIAQRFNTGRSGVRDIRETVRLGLKGAEELSAVEIDTLMEHYVDTRPLAENVGLAAEIVNALLDGVPEEMRGKKAPVEQDAAPATSPPSTTPAARSSGRRRTSAA